MRLAERSIVRTLCIAALTTVAGASCHDATEPAPFGPAVGTEPSIPSGPAFLWVMVVASSGICLEGATIEVVSGQRAGEKITQKTPCDAWSYDGGVTFQNLTAGLPMTLRATAPGYSVQEQTIVPASGPQTSVLFTPSRNP